MDNISVEELKKIQNNDILFIDVREEHEVMSAPFVGITSVHIPMNSVPDSLNEIDDSKHIVVACHAGGRSAKVCEYLISKNYTNVSNLTGGILAWSKEV